MCMKYFRRGKQKQRKCKESAIKQIIIYYNKTFHKANN